jgi:hypothetical protein
MATVASIHSRKPQAASLKPQPQASSRSRKPQAAAASRSRTPHAGATICASVRRSCCGYADSVTAGSVPITWNMPS